MRYLDSAIVMNWSFAPQPGIPLHSRIAFSAAHVVCDPFVDTGPLRNAQIDWDATLAYRHHLWSLGLGVEEAIDKAQRGMGLDWNAAKELISRSLMEAAAVGGKIARGVGTDHLTLRPHMTLKEVESAYEEQVG
jgi:hypothetical protein